ncbi:DegV family EDD domain-containing protein [Cohnella sp. CFH 77786]|uniref:DegV family protein n=1 Tax=Cohnella sp. CFH 77786 TaxID=2662265 RepID=UPI001C60D7A9|nr:DegV family protein [Cohnella sp. CFH 77786]MBW5444659.1 DegV family EDD domain-containing protein [Cohnella sp. CFH 77786]
MASVALVTDSTADIPRELRDRLGISMVPLKVMFGSETYLDNIELQPDEFYQKLTRSQALPTTSQPSPADFYDVFKKLTDEGRSVVSVHLSGAFSGTYQSAVIAKSMFEDGADITVIDSCSASYGYGHIVVAAAELAARGAAAEEVVAEVHRLRRAMRLYVLVDTLEYLQKGGRIGKAAALVGSLLNIKPILTIDDGGVITSVDKVRGQKRAMARIAELLEANLGSRPINLMIALTPGFDETAKELSALLKQRFDVRSYLETAIGPVVGTHAGPGTVGVFVTPA